MGTNMQHNPKKRDNHAVLAKDRAPQQGSNNSVGSTVDENINFPLLALPVDVLRRVLQKADLSTLSALSQCNKYLQREVRDDCLWVYLAMARFRVTLRTATSRHLQTAGPVSWRTLYSNWHTQARIPITRYSGPNIQTFAKGRACGVFAWFTVTSTEDCRLVSGNLRFRVVVQNVACGKAVIRKTAITFRVNTVGTIDVLRPSSDGHSAAIQSSVIDNASDNPNQDNSLLRNDVAVILGTIRIPGCIWEVDALERINAVVVPVIVDGKHCDIMCHLNDRFWESYELLPGGWWARVA